MSVYDLVSPFEPRGDQPQAIEKLVSGFKNGNKRETLLGVTGSGKTFTMAHVIKELGRPTLILAHNKTLAAQLYSEFKEFFPNDRVEYFVSYYDYYQPEAYVPGKDLYIEKDSSINEEIDRLRHSATASLFEGENVIIISSVSCIYGLGSPIDYEKMTVNVRPGMKKDRDEVIRQLIEIQYSRNDLDMKRGTFRVRGDTIDIIPAWVSANAIRVEFFGDEVDRIVQTNALTGEILSILEHAVIFPASHYIVEEDSLKRAIRDIEKELEEVIEKFTEENKLLELQRIVQRTKYDIEMMKETGFCSGIENYSRHLTGLKAGEPPHTLFDYFPDDFLLIIDESHMTLPQVRGMYGGDRSRKQNLVDYGFRLPSALDNRPLSFDEFEKKIDKVMFVSATPGPYEKEHEELYAEQIIRPTGLIDPEVIIRPVDHQIDDLIGEINEVVGKGFKVLITTLTKKMSENLTDYLKEVGIRVRYLHSDIDALERMEIIRDLRMNVFDVLIGINLLREGLDIPEVALVAILDADKEGFLRSETSLIQTVGRAARNSEGRVIMYADNVTNSMKNAIDETNRRRNIQAAFNEKNGITPTTITKAVRDVIRISKAAAKMEKGIVKDPESMSDEELKIKITSVKNRMEKAALELMFEEAAKLRDEMLALKKHLFERQ